MSSNEKFEKAIASGAYDRAIDRVNEAYEAEDYDKYEDLIERYSARFGVSYNFFEDACTDVRYWGRDIG